MLRSGQQARHGTTTAIAARTAIAAGAPVRSMREPLRGCPAELEVALDLGVRAVVESLENPLAILRADLAQQLLSAESTHLGLEGLLSQQRGHRLSKVAAVGNTYWSPFARPANRALLPPPPRDDKEILLAEDRPRMVAPRPDAELRTGARPSAEGVIRRADRRGGLQGARDR